MGLLFWPLPVALGALTLLEAGVKVALLIKEWGLCNYNSRRCCNGSNCANGDFKIWVP